MIGRCATPQFHRALLLVVLAMVLLAPGASASRTGGFWSWLTGLGAQAEVPESVAFPRPPYEEHALMARWLVHETSWGVLSTKDKATGEAVGGVVSHSDGSRMHATGRLFFYITPMDELTQNAMAHSRCTYTISEMQRRVVGGGDSSSSARSNSGDGGRTGGGGGDGSGGAGSIVGGPCGGLDPEDPACARATLLGRLVLVPDQERGVAQAAMFSRHPAMADWPPGHQFQFFELHVSEVHLLDWYGGMAIIDGEEYYAAATAAAGSGAQAARGTTQQRVAHAQSDGRV